MRTVHLVLLAIGLLAVFASGVRAEGSRRGQRLLGTWTVVNETADSTFQGDASTGQVTFAGDELTLDAGGLAAAGLVVPSIPSICGVPITPIKYKLVGRETNQIMFVSWTDTARKGGHTTARDAGISILKLSANQATLAGTGGCGAVGAPRLSYLTKVH